MKKAARWFAISLMLVAVSVRTGAAQSDRNYFEPVPESFYEGLAFDMPRVPVPSIPDYTVSIVDFGAVGDGETLNSEAFERAIDHVAERGGGRVVVPRGIWLTGPIILRSNLDLHVERGALVLFSDDFDLYPLVHTSYEGLRTMRTTSPISAQGVENVAITGEGVFDGSGGAWRPVKRFKMTEDQWEELVASGGVLNEEGDIWYPTEKALRGSQTPAEQLQTEEDYQAIKDFLRPVMVSIRESKNVLLDGPTFQNSPAWNIHPLMNENVVVRNLNVRNPWYAQNGDGLDLESTRNAIVYGNSFDVGDDAICLKSGKNGYGRRRGMPTENVIIRDNTVYHAHGGFVVGSEMSGGVRNIDVSNMTFIGTDVGIRFKSTRGRGGVVENIYISDVDMVDIVTEPIRFNLYYGGEAPSPGQQTEVVDREALAAEIPPVTVETPQFRNIHITNVRCRGAGSVMWIQGLPEMPVENVTIENATITAQRSALITEVDGLTLTDVSLSVEEGPVIYLNNGRDVTLQDVRLAYKDEAGSGTALRVAGPFTEQIRLLDVEVENVDKLIELGPNVEPEAVQRD